MGEYDLYEFNRSSEIQNNGEYQREIVRSVHKCNDSLSKITKILKSKKCIDEQAALGIMSLQTNVYVFKNSKTKVAYSIKLQ